MYLDHYNNPVLDPEPPQGILEQALVLRRSPKGLAVAVHIVHGYAGVEVGVDAAGV